MALPPAPAPLPNAERSYSGVLNRLIDTAKTVATVSDQLDRLGKEDIRIQGQILQLSSFVMDLTRQVSDAIGQLKGIEKRLEDREKLIELTIKLAIKEDLEKLRAELVKTARPAG